MAIQINAGATKKVKAPPVQAQATAQASTKSKVVDVFAQPATGLISTVDRMVELNDILTAHKAEAKEFDTKKKELQLIADAEGEPAKEFEVVGSHGNKVIYSAKSDQTEIVDRPGLLAALKAAFVSAYGEQQGYLELLNFVQVPLGELNKYLSEGEIAKFVKKSTATGPRKLKAVSKGA